MSKKSISIRPAAQGDLESVNRIHRGHGDRRRRIGIRLRFLEPNGLGDRGPVNALDGRIQSLVVFLIRLLGGQPFR